MHGNVLLQRIFVNFSLMHFFLQNSSSLNLLHLHNSSKFPFFCSRKLFNFLLFQPSFPKLEHELKMKIVWTGWKRFWNGSNSKNTSQRSRDSLVGNSLLSSTSAPLHSNFLCQAVWMMFVKSWAIILQMFWVFFFIIKKTWIIISKQAIRFQWFAKEWQKFVQFSILNYIETFCNLH